MNELQKLDVALFHLINDHGTPWLDACMRLISNATFWSIVGCGLLILFLVRQRSKLVTGLVLATLAFNVSHFTNHFLLKNYFARARPCYQLTHVRLAAETCGSEYGFPSSHAANAIAFAVCFAFFVRKNSHRALILCTALLVGLSRVYLGVHFPGDVLAGFAYGSAVGLSVLLASKIFFAALNDLGKSRS
jgi:undecaprenyl-diphosphatase